MFRTQDNFSRFPREAFGILVEFFPEVIGDLRDDSVFLKIGKPFGRDGFFAVDDSEKVSGDGAGGIAVAGDIHRFQHAGAEIPGMLQRTIDPDGQRLFRDPAFTEFGNAFRCPGFAQRTGRFRGIRLPGQEFEPQVQRFIQRFPGEAAGFISIDSAPLKRSYVTAAELWLLKRMEPVYRAYPWKRLEADGAKGCSETAYGRTLMKSFMGTYSKDEYCRLAAHGYRMLAEAYEADLPYEIDCPALLICGEKDKAGSTKRYNRKWAEKEGLPICWIPGAGHNSNTDRPEEINGLIRKFAEGLEEGER